jgi:hypothetical protein
MSTAISSPAHRAQVESARLVAQANQAVLAAVQAGEDLPREITGALLTLSAWARRHEHRE